MPQPIPLEEGAQFPPCVIKNTQRLYPCSGQDQKILVVLMKHIKPSLGLQTAHHSSPEKYLMGSLLVS